MGHVHSIVLLSPGFIKGYTGSELFLTSKALNKLMENKGFQSTLFGDILDEFPENVASLAREYLSMMVSEENFALIKEKGFHYLCVSRKNLTNYELSEDARTVMVRDSRKQKIRLT